MIIRIALYFLTINLCLGADNDLSGVLGFYLARSMKNICAVRGCTKSCKKEYMIGSMFGKEYFCKEHYDEILATLGAPSHQESPD